MVAIGSFEGRAYIVTGAGQGIGAATARLLAERGAAVLLADRTPGAAQAVAQVIERDGGRAIGIDTDVTCHEEVRAMVAQATSGFGRLDGAVNNAGVLSAHGATAAVDVNEWDRVMNVNLRGTMLCMREELIAILANGQPAAIVNVASAASTTAYPGYPAYVASKHGVLGLTRAAAVEYGERGIRINAICPGFVVTQMSDALTGGDEAMLEQLKSMYPLRRLAQPEEVAAAAIWLLSDESSYVTAAALAVDAGFTAQ